MLVKHVHDKTIIMFISLENKIKRFLKIIIITTKYQSTKLIAALPLALLRSPIANTNWKPMDARKFGHDVAYARTIVRPTTCKPMSNVTLDLAQIDTSLSVM